MSWIELRQNRQRVRGALREGYVDEVVACRATAFDEMAGAMNDRLFHHAEIISLKGSSCRPKGKKGLADSVARNR